MQNATGQMPQASGEQTTGELVKELTQQVSRLVREELKLAQIEMTRKGKQAGIGAGMLGGGGLLAFYGAGCLLACAIIAVSGAVAAWLAALIVGAALMAAAGVAALMGRARLRKATPGIPEHAIGNVKADVEEVKERAHR
jgi:hypothetical protein